MGGMAGILTYTPRMHRFRRFLMVCLLALALPMQGYAAQTMKLCGMGHPPAAVVLQDHSAHQHQHQLQHHHDAEAAGAHQHDGKCSVCATCCNAAALRSIWAAPPVALIPSHLVPTIPHAHSRLAVGGLDRPPRSSLS